MNSTQEDTTHIYESIANAMLKAAKKECKKNGWRETYIAPSAISLAADAMLTHKGLFTESNRIELTGRLVDCSITRIIALEAKEKGKK